MTGFGRGEAQDENWRVVVFIKSVNGKGLDFNLRLPAQFLFLDPELRKKVKESLKRGSLQCTVNVESKGFLPPVDVQVLKASSQALKELLRGLDLKVSDDLIFETAWKHAERLQKSEEEETIANLIRTAFEQALKELIESREREGKAIKEDLLARVEKIEKTLDRIESEKERIRERIKERIVEKAKEIGLDENSLLPKQEILFLLERMDVEEEISRLKEHLRAFRKLLSSEEEVGKKLEFLAQEMHREITTLGNKIPDLHPFVVEIKAEVDRIKQQSANVE